MARYGVRDHDRSGDRRARPSELRGRLGHILVVEDDPDLAPVLKLVVSSAGYPVDVVATCAEARARLAAGGYGLVLADWALPDGSGIAFADEAKARGAKTIVVTGYAMALPPAAFVGHECLMKPVRADELLDIIERCFAAA